MINIYSHILERKNINEHNGNWMYMKKNVFESKLYVVGKATEKYQKKIAL